MSERRFMVVTQPRGLEGAALERYRRRVRKARRKKRRELLARKKAR